MSLYIALDFTYVLCALKDNQCKIYIQHLVKITNYMLGVLAISRYLTWFNSNLDSRAVILKGILLLFFFIWTQIIPNRVIRSWSILDQT